MKKIILFAAMAILTVTASAQAKFARVNFTELVQLMPEADAARAQMDAANKEAQETYQSMINEYQTKGTEYQNKQASWTQTIRESKQKELMEIENRINEFQQSIQNELSQQQQQLMNPIQEKAFNAVNKIAKDGGYTFVFDASQYFYADPNVKDLTPDARKVLGIPADRTLESLSQELQAKAAADAK